MPYPGIKPGSDKEKKMERCVERVMSEDSSKTKSQAIAICRSSIDGKKKADMPDSQDLKIYFDQDYWSKAVEGAFRDSLKFEGLGKALDGSNTKGEEVEEKVSKTKDEIKDEKVEEEVVKTETPETEVEEENTAKADEADADEAKEEAEEVTKSDDEAEEEAKPEAEAVNAEQVNKVLTTVINKIEALEARLTKAEESEDEDDEESESAEDVTAKAEDASESDDEESDKEEDKTEKVDTSSGDAESLVKVEDAMTKLSETVTNSLEKFESTMSKFEERINALEEQPEQTKVVANSHVVSKSDTQDVDVSEEDANRLAEIKTELEKLDDVRKNNLEKYQADNLGERAWKLITERDAITARVNNAPQFA